MISVPMKAAQKRGLVTSRDREAGAKFGVDVGDAKFFRDCRQVGGPADVAGAFELGQIVARVLHEGTQRRVVDDEVHLRPVFRRLADIVDRGVAPGVRNRGFVVLRQQSFVDAEVG